jgi:hypothetical protein
MSPKRAPEAALVEILPNGTFNSLAATARRRR